MNDKKYKYGIVIPHYNSSKLLRRMLSSIPERDDLQIVVVDDCSKSEEVEALKGLSHQNLQIVLMEHNHGAGFARNEGLKRISSEWVTFVDSDDMFADNAFEVLDDYVESDNDLLCYYVKAINDKTKKELRNVLKSESSVRSFFECKTKKNENLFRYRNNVCWNKLVRTDFLKKYHIDFEACEVNNDVLYTLRIGMHIEKYLIIPKELYLWMENSESMTRKKRSIEREYKFYLQAQKRNGFFRYLGLNHYPFYRSNLLYFLYFMKKRGFVDTLRFFRICHAKREEISKARKAYLNEFNNRK